MNNNGHVELIDQTSISSILDIEIKKHIAIKNRKIEITLYFITIMLLILNIIIGLSIYFLYISVDDSVRDLKKYIDANVPNLKNFLDNYELHIKLN